MIDRRPRRQPGWLWLVTVVVVSLMLWALVAWGGITLYRWLTALG